MDKKSQFDSPIFARWGLNLIDQYKQSFFNMEEDLTTPPRKGVPKGEKCPFSISKYEAAVLNVLYSPKLGRTTLQDLCLGLNTQSCSESLLRKWRTEPRFRKLVNTLKAEFSEHMARNIFFGSSNYDGFLPFFEPFKNSKSLIVKLYYVREGLSYPPDLLKGISSALAAFAISKDTVIKISDFIGHHIWVIELLNLAKFTTPKSPLRKVYLDVLNHICGKHFENVFLLKYLVKFSSPDKGFKPRLYWRSRFKNGAKLFSKSIFEARFDETQSHYREELAAIINSGIDGLSDQKSILDASDLKTAVKYLSGNYQIVDGDIWRSFKYYI